MTKTRRARETGAEDAYCMPPRYERSRTGPPVDTESELVAARGWRSGELGLTDNRHRASFWAGGKVLELDRGDSHTTS